MLLAYTGLQVNPSAVDGGVSCEIDPYAGGPSPKTVLLLQMEAATDTSGTPKTVTLVGSAALSSAQSKFGSKSLFVPDTGSSSSGALIVTDHTDFDFGTGDFTIDLWAYRAAHTFVGYMYSVDVGGTNMAAYLWEVTGEVRIRWATSSSSVEVNTGVNMATGAWVHHRFQRRGTNFEWYMAGTLRNTRAVPGGAGATVNASGNWYFGSNNSNPSTQKMGGYVDEVRVVKGIALATGSFTPPTLPTCGGTVAAPAPPPMPQPPAAQPIAFAASAVSTLSGIVGDAIASTALATITCADTAMTVSLSETVPGLTFDYTANVLTVAGTPTTGGAYRVVVSYIASDGSYSIRGSTSHTVNIADAAVPFVVGSCANASGRVGQPIDVTLCTPSIAANVPSVTISANVSFPASLHNHPFTGQPSQEMLAWEWSPGASSTGTLRLYGTPTVGSIFSGTLTVTYRTAGYPQEVLGTSTHQIDIVAAYVAPPAPPAPAPAPPAPTPVAPPPPAPVPTPGPGPEPALATVKALYRFNTTPGIGYNERTGVSLSNLRATLTTGAVAEAALFAPPGSSFAASLNGQVDDCSGEDGNLTVECMVDIDSTAWDALTAPGLEDRYCPVVSYIAAGALVWSLGFAGVREVAFPNRRIVFGVLFSNLTGTWSGGIPGSNSLTVWSSPGMTTRPGRFVHLCGARRRNPTNPADGLFDTGAWFDGLAGGARAVPSLSLLPAVAAGAGFIRIGGMVILEYLDNARSVKSIAFSGAIDEARVTAASRHGDLLLPGVGGLGLQVSAIPSTRRVIPWPNY